MPQSRSRKISKLDSGRKTRKRRSQKTKFTGWKTSDQEEVERRKLRATHEPIRVEALDSDQPFYGTYRAQSQSGHRAYIVQIRSLADLQNSCECPDFRVNGLGTCKHIEAVLASLKNGQVRRFRRAAREGSPRTEIFLSWEDKRSGPDIRVAWSPHTSDDCRKLLSPFFSASGILLADPLHGVPALQRAVSAAPNQIRSRIRIARDVESWVDELRRRQQRIQSREDFLSDLRAGKRSVDFLKHPLYSYQQDGMLHLAFGERVILADDMGLGKTVQAVAACELLRRLHGIERVLVVAPVSLKSEWEEQIDKFTDLSSLLIWGPRAQRLKFYRQKSFFYLTNYEQVRNDFEDINRILAPDVVILDEAQRIKNWQTKTAKSVKNLSSPYAFVLTGTPLENRIDEIYSIVDFVDPQILGSLFRFNREFYELDENGKPTGYKNLDVLYRRLRPVVLRRRKEEVEDQLPERTVNNFFVQMKKEQRIRYEEYRVRAARLVATAQRRQLTPEESERLQRTLACMRMICDTPFILDDEYRLCPKVEELESILEELLESRDTKILIFSEWERMLFLVRDLVSEMGIGYAWHTGSVTQQERRRQVNLFKKDINCRLFLSTDAGSTGLNLQAANVVINLDLPWNPARLEQRIARAWRKQQKRRVSVINLVCQNSIEHRMLGLLTEKQQLADRVVDGRGDMNSMPLPSGKAAFMKRLEELMGMDLRRISEGVSEQEENRTVADKDPTEGFRDDLLARHPGRILLVQAHNGEEKEKLLIVVDREAEKLEPPARRILERNFAGSSEKPLLEVIDRATYERIQRLVKEGFLKANGGSARRLYGDSFAGDCLDDDEKALRRAEADKLLAAADRKIRMAELLIGGGFSGEAVRPASEAAKEALHSLAVLQGKDLNDGMGGNNGRNSLDLDSLAAIGMPEPLVSAAARLFDSANSERAIAIKEEVAGELLRSSRQILDHAQVVVNQEILG